MVYCIFKNSNAKPQRKLFKIWTPALSNILRIEKADLLAKMGANLVAYGPEPFFSITEKKCNAVCNNQLNEKLVQRWRVTDRSTHTRKFHINTISKACRAVSESESKLDLSITIGI